MRSWYKVFSDEKKFCRPWGNIIKLAFHLLPDTFLYKWFEMREAPCSTRIILLGFLLIALFGKSYFLHLLLSLFLFFLGLSGQGVFLIQVSWSFGHPPAVASIYYTTRAQSPVERRWWSLIKSRRERKIKSGLFKSQFSLSLSLSGWLTYITINKSFLLRLCK